MDALNNEERIPTAHLDELVLTLASALADRDALRNILEAMINAVFIVSSDGVIQHMNQSACELLESGGGELIGAPVERVLGGGRSWRDDCMTEVMHQGAIRSREMGMVSLSGRSVPVLFSSSALRSRPEGVISFVCSAQDISEHIRLRASLNLSRESFQAIVDKSADGILIIDHAGLVKFVNPAGEHLLGRSWSEMMDMPFGRPLIGGEVAEVDVIRKNGGLGVAEMRLVETDWHGMPSFLVSLRDVTENVRLREELQKLSMEDALTGLHNRRGFMMLAEQEFKIAMRSGGRMSLIFIDLDGMKDINDRLGHKMGDQALLETAAIMRKVFRKSDLLCRQGGDEFLALSLHEPHDDPHEMGGQIKRRLEQELRQRNAQPGRSYRLSLSMGVTPVWATTHSDLEQCIQQADAAMYEAKMANKHKLHWS
ncbi:MAG: diguanylate cyclase [Magnetococcales bacterium]|nr:diguanylate cyclase [Magnetococcales bacterium]